MQREIIFTDKASPPGGAYSQAVKVGQLVFTAGMAAIDPETKKLIAPGDIGAREIILPYTRHIPIKSESDFDVIRQRGIVSNDMLIASSHPQRTLRMGSHPRHSVVDTYGEAHAVKGLFVTDASLFPSSIGIPPTLTIAALADRIARRLAVNWPL